VLDGHVPRQLQGVALEGAGVALLGLGEGDLHLANLPAGKAIDPGHWEVDQNGFATNRDGAEGAVHASLGPDFLGTALGATPAFAGLFDVEGHGALLELLANRTVADEAKGVIQ